MRAPFLLILSTSGGAGHHRAAESLLEAAHGSAFRQQTMTPSTSHRRPSRDSIQNYGRYLRSLRSLSPDLILCTHFLPFVSLSERDLLKEGFMAPFFASITDFDVHQLWIDKRVKRYYVHDDETAWQLSSKGVDPALIGVTGIPVVSGFSRRNEPDGDDHVSIL